LGSLSEGFGHKAYPKPQAAIFSEAPLNISPTCIEAHIDYNNKAFRIVKCADGGGYDLESVIVTCRSTWVPDDVLERNIDARTVLETIAPYAHPMTLRDVNEFLGYARDYVLPPKLEVLQGGYQTLSA
jgi:hypothetical protein